VMIPFFSRYARPVFGFSLNRAAPVRRIAFCDFRAVRSLYEGAN
jgi:hypothetical protein